MGNGGRYSRVHDVPKVGARYGEVTVTGIILGPFGGVRGVECTCACGAATVIAESSLRHGRTTRCSACGRSKGNRSRIRYPEIEAAHRRRIGGRISAIFGRCNDPDNAQFAQYGGRGVSVYAPWVADRREFMCYLTGLTGWDDPHLTIDRIDNDRGYEPGNLRFVSLREQQQNKTSTHWVEYRGERMSASDFWRRFCPRYARIGTVLRKLSEGSTPQQVVDDQRFCRGAYGVRYSGLRST